MTSPRRSDGTVTSSREIGSSTTGAALAIASRKARRPAARNAISELSTLCSLPSVRVTRTSTTG